MKFDDVTFDSPAVVDWLDGKQFARDAEVVWGIPLDAVAVGVDQTRHRAEHSLALIEQAPLDHLWRHGNVFGEPCCDLG